MLYKHHVADLMTLNTRQYSKTADCEAALLSDQYFIGLPFRMICFMYILGFIACAGTHLSFIGVMITFQSNLDVILIYVFTQ